MDNVPIEWIQISGRKCLKFTFENKLDKQKAVKAIEKWKGEFASNPNEKIILIWDCSKMNRYETEARIQWQNALKEMKNQIDCIWLITKSSFIKMGASVMSLFTSYKIEIVSSESEIKIK